MPRALRDPHLASRRGPRGRVELLLTVLGTLLLLWPALRNGFPLVFHDTIAHLHTSVAFIVVPDRPPGYGLFLTLAELTGTIWVPVLLQALFTSLLLVRLLFVYGGARRPQLAVGGLVVFFVTTNVAKYPSWLMPDAMFAWLLLGVLLALASTRCRDQLIATIAIVMAVVVANTHLVIGLGIAALLVGWLLCRWRAVGPLRRRQVLRIAALLACGWPLAALVSAGLGAGFTPTRGGSIFFAARLHEDGLLLAALDAHCGARKWRLCAHRETLRRHPFEIAEWYLWDRRESPLYQVGHWSPPTEKEHGEVVRAALRDQPLVFLRTSSARAWSQLWTIDSTAGLRPPVPDDLLERMASYLAEHDRRAFVTSPQYRGQDVRVRLLLFDESWLHRFFLGLTLLLAAGFLLRRQPVSAHVLLATLVFLLGGAALIGLAGTVVGRYMARVGWLLPFGILLSLVAVPRWRR